MSNSESNKKFTKREPADLLDVNRMLQIDDNWFDVDPLIIATKNEDRHLIYPKIHMGVNTIGGSLGRHYDIKGDIPNPKITVSPWTNSTIEPDYNTRIAELCKFCSDPKYAPDPEGKLRRLDRWQNELHEQEANAIGQIKIEVNGSKMTIPICEYCCNDRANAFNGLDGVIGVYMPY